MAHIPSADELFRTYFMPLYPPDALADLAKVRTVDVNPANNPSVIAPLREAADIFAGKSPEIFGGLALDFSDESIHRLSQALTSERVAGWLASSPPGPSHELVNILLHASAYVGECIVRQHAGVWSARQPLWESMVLLQSSAGESSLAIFHWLLKSLGDLDREGGVTLADRYRTHVEIPCFDAQSLPVIVQGERKLPRLSKVRYDMLFKYMKAHVPEFRDLGKDFPSPERFDAYRFKWLEGHVIGGGRMFLLTGLGSGGLHMFWLDGTGFQKALHIPTDSFPDPIVRVGQDKLCAVYSREGRVEEDEMLWWGR